MIEMDRRLSGRESLLDAAAVLMDERGIDDVSVNDIQRLSGHRNRSAVTYHFGTRDDVVRALVTRTITEVDAERNALLDHLESVGTPMTTRTVLEILVGPAARLLRDVAGRRYLRLCGQLIDHPRFVADTLDVLTANTSVRRCADHLAPQFADVPRPVAAERASMMVGLLVRTLADQARLLDSEQPTRPPLAIPATSANLVDVLLAIVEAPTTVHPEASDT